MSTSWTQMNDKLCALAKTRHIPLIGQFELTARCNMKCKMCYISKSAADRDAMAKELTAEQWLQLAREAKEKGMLYVLLTGGEALLHPQFKEIYLGLSDMGMLMALNTNATMITPELAAWLGDHPPLRVFVTLYGACSETYEELCGYKDGLDKALKGIDLLLEQGINVSLRTTIVEDNKEELVAMVDFASERKLEFGIINYVFPRRDKDGSGPEQLRLSPESLASYEAYVTDVFSNNSKAQFDMEEQGSVPFFESMEENHGYDENGAFYCDGGTISCWMTWDGYMLPCGMADEPKLSLQNSGFAAAWSNLRHECRKIPACAECKGCEYRSYCMTCPARLKGETGCFEKPAKYLCDLAKARKRLHEKFLQSTQTDIN